MVYFRVRMYVIDMTRGFRQSLLSSDIFSPSLGFAGDGSLEARHGTGGASCVSDGPFVADNTIHAYHQCLGRMFSVPDENAARSTVSPAAIEDIISDTNYYDEASSWSRCIYLGAHRWGLQSIDGAE
jgi:hypothetical protein